MRCKSFERVKRGNAPLAVVVAQVALEWKVEELFRVVVRVERGWS